jgi:membrane-associated phospholipid phosphatase
MLRASLAFAGGLLLGLWVHAHTPSFDAAAVRHMHGWLAHRHLLIDVVKALTTLGTVPLLALALVVLAVVRPRLRTDAFVLLAALVAAYVVGHGLKMLLDRPRPPVSLRLASASGASYPSGHAIQAAAVYGAAAWRWRGRWVVAVASAVVVLVAVSRVALCVHYPTDVVGGVVLGAAIVFTIGAVERLRTAAPTRPPPH